MPAQVTVVGLEATIVAPLDPDGDALARMPDQRRPQRIVRAAAGGAGFSDYVTGLALEAQA